jgi:hypothetical protein
MNKYSFYDIEQWLLKKGLLRMENELSTDLSLYEFIKHFLSTYWRYCTIYVRNGRPQQTGSARSIGDIYRVCKYYFPKVSLVEVYNVMIRLIKEKRISSNICGTVHKRVYESHTDSLPSTYNSFSGASTDEFGVDFTSFDIRKSKEDEQTLNHYKII